MDIKTNTYNIYNGKIANGISLSNLLKESSYLFYEIDDVLKINNEGSNFSYTESISPLFDSNTIDANFNKNLLEIIFEKTPFYHIEPRGEIRLEDIPLSSTRDVGINDVASPLQTDFWEVLFRNALGSVQNELLLDIYNKLRYPFIGENQYLNAGLFPELSKKYFQNKGDSSGNELIFRNTISDNIDDIYSFILNDLKKENVDISKDNEVKEFVRKRQGTPYMGCLDILNKTVNDKIKSMYALLNYNPFQSSFLEEWVSSLKNSGKLTDKDMEKEKSIYRLQDIKYELLRRKFAGSSTLYKIALASIGRRGSLLQTTSVGSIFNISSDKMFRDGRILRIIAFPGILTNPIKKDILQNLSPYDAFYQNKSSSNNLPLGILLPLYYTSAPVQSPLSTPENFTDREEYSSDKFFINMNEESAKLYRSSHLRNISNVINLNNPISPVSASEFNRTFTKLDIFKINFNVNPPERDYNKLDTGLRIEIPGREPIHQDINKLDISVPILTSSSINGSVLDISIDSILYHKNSLQKINAENYEYPTYPISNNTSLSLMDNIWLDTLNTLTNEKTRVQDKINFGSQISFYTNNDLYPGVPVTFFAISYGDDTVPVYEDNDIISWKIASNYLELNKNTFGLSEWINIKNVYPKYAYLWKYEMFYDHKTFKVHFDHVRPTLISKITLKLDGMVNGSLNPYGGFNVENSAMINEINLGLNQSRKEKVLNVFNTHMGVIPFTYPEFKNNTCLFSKLGPVEENGKYAEYDDIENLNYQKAIFKFSDFDIVNQVPNIVDFAVEPEAPEEPEDGVSDENYNNFINYKLAKDKFNRLFTPYPTEDTATLYYGIREDKIHQTTGDISSTNTLNTIIKNIRFLENFSTNSEYTYRWSSGIKVLKLTHNIFNLLAGSDPNLADQNLIKNIYKYDKNDKESILTYNPDWKSIQYHLNPYMNFTRKSASPLRKKNVLVKTGELDDTDNRKFKCIPGLFSKKGEKIDNLADTKTIILSNLARDRHQDYLCNDSGVADQSIWLTLDPNINSSKTRPIGYYLEHIYDKNRQDVVGVKRCTYSDIFGDNRFNEDYYTSKGYASYGEYKRNSSYTDSFTENFCLNFRESPFPIGIKNKPDSEITPINKIILNYFKLLPCSLNNLPEYGNDPTSKPIEEITESDKNLWKSWSWNQPKTGLTVAGCFEIFKKDIDQIFKEQLPSTTTPDKTGGNTTWHIIGRKNEFSVDLVGFNQNNYDFKLKFTIYTTNNKGEISPHSIESSPINISSESKEVRFAGSLIHLRDINPSDGNIRSNYKITIITNDHIFSDYIAGDPQTFPILYYGMSIGSKLAMVKGPYQNDSTNELESEEKEDIGQIDIFRGNLYDLRLFNKGFTEMTLLFLQAGSVKELYSHSPSVYKLGYNIYEDLGILKFYKKINPGQPFPEVDALRIFNREVWDSILPDRHPISEDELAPNSYSYYPPNIYHLNDTDIYKQVTVEEGPPKKYIYKPINTVEQYLKDYVEVVNNFNKFTTDESDNAVIISYNKPLDTGLMPGNNPLGTFETKLRPQDTITMINTLIKPTLYDNVDFFSGSVLDYKLGEEDEEQNQVSFSNITYPIEIPTNIESGFKYNADLNINFIESSIIDLSSYYYKGENIYIEGEIDNLFLYPVKNNKEGSTYPLLNKNITPTDNLILTSFVIPDQENIKNKNEINIFEMEGKLNKLYTEDILLNSNINRLLAASSYYKEIGVPYMYKQSDSIKYNIRYHAVRILKEGTYYISFKYPMQFLPFSEKNKSTNDVNKTYNTYYGTVRLKIEVKGTPKISDPLENNVVYNNGNKIPNDVLKEEDLGVDSVALEYTCEDNRTFPHRIIDINVYAMDSISVSDNSTYEGFKEKYVWKLIASNDSNKIKDKITDLSDLEKLGNSPKEPSEWKIYINEKVPILFSNCYTSPFFISPFNISSNSETIDIIPDQKPPITIRPYSRVHLDDMLYVNNISNLNQNSQIISAGKAYRFLFDYTSNLCELSYSPYYFGAETSNNIYEIGKEELSNYNFNYDILNSLSSKNKNDYRNYFYVDFKNEDNNYYSKYLKTGESSIEALAYKKNGGGFKVYKDENEIKWKITDITDTRIDYIGNRSKVYFGNPYDLSPKYNKLLPEDANDLNPNDYLYSFIYDTEDGPGIEGGYLKKIPYVDSSNFNRENPLESRNFDENKYVSKKYSIERDAILGNLRGLKESTCGIFQRMNKLLPNIFYINRRNNSIVPNEYINDYKTIISSKFDLCTYFEKPLNLVKNTTTAIKNYKLYGNNLIKNFNFEDNDNNWKTSYTGEFAQLGQEENIFETLSSIYSSKYIPGLMHHINSSLGVGKPVYEITLSNLKTVLSNEELELTSDEWSWKRNIEMSYKFPEEISSTGTVTDLAKRFIIYVDLNTYIEKSNYEPGEIKNLCITAYLYNGDNKILGAINLTNTTNLYGKDIDNPKLAYNRYYGIDDKNICNGSNITSIKYEITFELNNKNIKDDDVIHLNISDIGIISSDSSEFKPNLGLWILNSNLENRKSIELSSYQAVAFKPEFSNDFSNFIPITFKPEKTKQDGVDIWSSRALLGIVKPFFKNKYDYDILKLEDPNVLITLNQPWVYNLEVKEEIVEGENKIVPHLKKYNFTEQKFVKKEFAEGDIDITYEKYIDNSNSLIESNTGFDSLIINKMNMNVKKDSNGLFSIEDFDEFSLPNSNLRLNIFPNDNDNAGNTSKNNVNPISILNEKISGLVGCFNPKKYDGKYLHPSKAAVTNIQLLEKDTGDVIAELEYLPIIYDESKHHLSLNILFHHN